MIDSFVQYFGVSGLIVFIYCLHFYMAYQLDRYTKRTSEILDKIQERLSALEKYP